MEDRALLLYTHSHSIIEQINQTNDVIDFVVDKILKGQQQLDLLRIQTPDMILIEHDNDYIKHKIPFQGIQLQISLYLNAILVILVVFIVIWLHENIQ
ncbi:hypothetical protein SS50377_21782 [Spironucleus salmonicida]|uniref:Uncharacterized protein n=1 Tax=Spironucleus salmonicida TaxID=348837 RepID=A0A9P8LXS9_9EUKA|nr:hypothetical protein SS50377_21782 [Spironucleus salmonicida]